MILLDFPTKRDEQEQAEDILLAALQARDQVRDLIEGMAQLLYKARAIHIGGL